MTLATTDPRAASERVQALLAELATESPQVADRAEELVRQLMQLYGAALSRIVDATREVEGEASATLAKLVDDELVASLLVLHDLHPQALGDRVQAALDKVRPYLGSHGGSVEIVGIEDETVHIRMAGSCNGCPSSAVTLTYAIERAILEVAPEIARVV
ncbi:MAG: NifU family protein, partial [Candidatus Limnocylindria bacterium]